MKKIIVRRVYLWFIMLHAKEVSSITKPKSYSKKTEMVPYTFVYLKSWTKKRGIDTMALSLSSMP